MLPELASCAIDVASEPATFRPSSIAERRALAELESRYPLAHGQWILTDPVPLNSALTRHIGNTPLVGVDMLVDGTSRRVLLKLEGYNPGGSIKDRTAFSMIGRAERSGQLRPGATILESTSGNLGVALALLGRARGYRFRAVIDPKTSWLNVRKLQALGAELDLVDQTDSAGGYLLSRLERVSEYLRSGADYLWMNQYANVANPEAHRRMTGPEILAQSHGTLDAVFVAVSTCGTLAGIGQFLRSMAPHARVVAVDVVGSAIFGQTAAQRRLTGIGSSQSPQFSVQSLIDDVVIVDDTSAMDSCRALALATDIRVGGSSGAVLAACSRYLQQHSDLEQVVCLCPDTGRNYEDTIYANTEGW